jgi:FMN phosphatase YigB (HAD superfamily)
MTRIEFIYFDLGNVLISFDHSLACQQIAELTGISFERAGQILFESGLQTQYERGEISTAEFHEYFCGQARVNVSLKELCFAASNIFEPLDDSIQLLQTLKRAGHRIGLLSNTCDCHWQFCLDDSRFEFLHSSFELTVLSHVVGIVKPDSEIYRIAAKQANCSPERVLFIDDKAENVNAALTYGFDSIHFLGLSELLDELQKRELIGRPSIRAL